MERKGARGCMEEWTVQGGKGYSQLNTTTSPAFATISWGMKIWLAFAVVLAPTRTWMRSAEATVAATCHG